MIDESPRQRVKSISVDAPPYMLRALARRAMEEGRLDEASQHLLNAAKAATPATKDARRIAAHLNNLATAFSAVRRDADAVSHLKAAISLDPAYVLAHVNLGTILLDQRRHVEARDAFDRALAIAPDDPTALAGSLDTRLAVADWTDLERDTRRLVELIHRFRDSGRAHNVRPYLALQLGIDNAERLRIAADWAARFTGHDAFAAPGVAHRPLRIGYLSSDFRDHPVAHLLAPVFAAHDRKAVEIYAFSTGADDGSAERRRIERDCDKFVDLRALGDAEAEAAITAEGIDILVDLGVWTGSARAGIAARQPAPIQVAYFGYPGSSGAPWIDYIIVDKVVVPRGDRKFFSERLVTLPRTYLVADRNQAMAAGAMHRADWGLPEEAFVYACFNYANRIEPRVFQLWLEILNAVPDSVLWLHGDYSETRENLRHTVALAGIEPGRLVFAERETRPRHLRRQRCADLFLDTLRYNAHATACDSLAAGLPLLTCRGRAFAGRVAASVLTTLGLDELIAEDHRSYVTKAVALAGDRAELTRIRQRLIEALSASPLGDFESLAGYLEAAFRAMWEIHVAGETPRDIEV